jgi:hypothetical protein
MALLPPADVYGYTIFCDDIRQEADGKLLFIGVYSGPMIVHVPFPVTLPTFAMSIALLQRRSGFVPNLGLRIFLPGDADDIPSVQAEMSEVTEGSVASATSAVVDALHPDAQVREEDTYITMLAHMKFTQFVIKQPGVVKVRALVRDDMIRLGEMRISSPPQEKTV